MKNKETKMVKKAEKKTRLKSSLPKTKIKKITVIRPVTSGPVGFDKTVHFVVTTFFAFLRYVLVFLLGVGTTIIIISFFVFLLYSRSISKASDISLDRLFSVAVQGRNRSQQRSTESETILVLGTDALINRDEQSKLTDTIMVVSINSREGKINVFNLPRDLWIASQSSKVNGLYAKDPKLPKTVISSLIGLPIHDQMVIDIATVGKMIDAFGGLDVTIERSFVDYRFPRSDVDVRTEHDINKLYETVAFTKGNEHMSGDRALRYIRSRHSVDPIEGTDDARVRRQQQVIQALLAKMKDPMLIRNPEQIGRILQIYTQDIQTTLTLEDAVGLGWTFLKKKSFPQLITHQFTIKEVDKNGAFTHPERFPGGAWVYLPVDPTYGQIRAQVAAWLAE